MHRSSARRRSSPLLWALLVLALSGCAGSESATPKPSPTPIADLNTAALQVPRIEFCDVVPASAVRAALGGEAASDAAYGNGDEVALPGVGTDVVHEIGCSWTAKAGDSARAWVFARPVDGAFARRVAAAGRRDPGCRPVAGPAYGRPSTTQLCRTADGSQRVRHAGLFGQTWLSCEVSTPRAAQVTAAEVRTRADRWCVEVAGALNTAR